MDLLVRDMNPRILIRIRTKMSRIRNTAWRGMQIEEPRLPFENISGYDRMRKSGCSATYAYRVPGVPYLSLDSNLQLTGGGGGAP